MFSIGAFAIVMNESGQVLLCHRRDSDAWNLPGGGVENGEMPTEAVLREVEEETGLEVVIERLVGVYGKVVKDELVFVFTCREIGGELRPTDIYDRHDYFGLEEIPAKTPPKHVGRVRDALQNTGDLLPAPIIRRETGDTLRDVNGKRK